MSEKKKLTEEQIAEFNEIAKSHRGEIRVMELPPTPPTRIFLLEIEVRDKFYRKAYGSLEKAHAAILKFAEEESLDVEDIRTIQEKIEKDSLKDVIEVNWRGHYEYVCPYLEAVIEVHEVL